MKAQIILQEVDGKRSFVKVEPPELSKFVTVAGNKFIAIRSGVYDLTLPNLDMVEWEFVVAPCLPVLPAQPIAKKGVR